MGIFQSVSLFPRAFIMGRAAAAVENLALRQQVAVFKQSSKPPSQGEVVSVPQVGGLHDRYTRAA